MRVDECDVSGKLLTIVRGRSVVPVDNLHCSPKISWVEKDKHNAAVNSPELASQFAHQIGEIQSGLTVTS